MKTVMNNERRIKSLGVIVHKTAGAVKSKEALCMALTSPERPKIKGREALCS